MLDLPDVRGAILVHMGTGKILYHKDMHQRLAPASMTKMMTLLLAIERIQRGEIKLTDTVTISEFVTRTGGNRMDLEVGEVVTVEDLLKMVAIPSYNDAATALAEHITGNYADFVDLMNAKARELGMKNTNFRSAHGLIGATRHFSSPYDMAKLSKALIETELIFNYCSVAMLLIKHFTIFEFTYLAGLGGAMQALITPDLGHYSYPHFRTFQFFIAHGAIVLACIFMIFVEKYKPTLRSVWKAFLLLNVVSLIAGLTNWLTGGNYMFLARKPQGASLMDLLGPWPWYILALEGVALFSFFVFFSPFFAHHVYKKRKNKQPSA